MKMLSSIFKLVPQNCLNYLLRYCSPNLCKWNYFLVLCPSQSCGQGWIIWCHPKFYDIPFFSDCEWLYNIHKTRRGVFFLPPSDAYVRSFLYLLYTLIKLHYTKALSDPASSLAPDWIRLLWRPRILASYLLATTFHLGGSSGILQDKVRMLGALVLCSPSKHVFRCTLLTPRCACVNESNALHEASEEPCSEVPRRPYKAYGRNLSGVYTDLPVPRGNQCLLWELIRNGQSVWTELSFLGQTSRSLWPFHNSLGIRSTNLIYPIIGFQGACDLCCYSSVV